jgi:hypothetical protein
MAITCLCPHCQKTLAISEQFAGQPMRCPLCMALFQAPAAAPAIAGRVTVPPVPDLPTLVPGSRGATLPPVPDLPTLVPGSGGPPVIANSPPPTPSTAPEGLQDLRTSSRLPTGWHMVRRGLSIIPPAVLIALFVLLGTVAFLKMADPDRTTYEVVMLLVVPVTVLSLTAAVLGGAMCSLVPAESGLRKLALAAAGCLLGALGLGLLILAYRVFAMKQAGKPSALDSGSYWPCYLLAFAGGMVFLLFLRGVARFFKNQRLVQSILWCMIGIGASPLVFLVIYFLLWATSAAVGGDGSGLAILSGLVLYTIIGADLFWFLRVLGEVRQTVAKGYLGAAA